MHKKKLASPVSLLLFLGMVFSLSIIVALYFINPIKPHILQRTSLPDSKNLSFADNDKNKVKQTSLGFAGDIMLGRTVEIEANIKEDHNYPFQFISEKTREVDIFFGNLENPIIRNCPPHRSGFTFCANPEMIDGLKYAGVDIVTLANNHTYNYGQGGFQETIEHLHENDILLTGDGKLEIRDKNGTTFGFVGIDKAQLGNPTLSEKEKDLILNSDKQVDILIVAPHWGVEYKNVALPGVKNLAKELIALGADTIIGSHPHWVQEAEFFNQEGDRLKHQTARDLKRPQSISFSNDDKKVIPVYYSLGNFVFDQMWSEETKKGLYVELVYEGIKLVEVKEYPTYMKTHAQPEFVDMN